MTFWSVVKNNSTNVVHFTGTNPQGMRLHLPNAALEDKTIVKIYYQAPLRLQVFVGSTFVEDMNRLDGKNKEQLVRDGRLSLNNVAGGYTQQLVDVTHICNIGGTAEEAYKCMSPSNTHGSNRFNRDEGMLEIVVARHSSENFIEIKSMPVVQVSMGVSTSVEDFYTIKDTFLSSLSAVLGIDFSRITIVDVVAGNARRRSQLRNLLSSNSRSLLQASTTVVNFEVEPSPLIGITTATTTVLEDVGYITVVVVRSVNINGMCGVLFSVSNRSSDNATPNVNFVAATGLLQFKSQEETKYITVQILNATGYTPDVSRLTVTIHDAENATLGGTLSIKIYVEIVHMPSPDPPTLAATGTTAAGVMLQWSRAVWSTAPLAKYNETRSWQIACSSDGVSLNVTEAPASVLTSFLGGLSAYVPVVCRARADAEGWSSWSSWSSPMYTLAICGDGSRQGQEECDDGNAVSGDGCADCVVDVGFACSVAAGGDICSNGCRNGTKEEEEMCDDGNAIIGDGCDTKCEVESGFLCAATVHPTIPNAVHSNCSVPCGDGLRVQNQEECDDGNALDNDGCSSSCTVDSGFTCVASADQASICQKCGNGILEGSELCDDAAVSDACVLCSSVKTGWRCSGVVCAAGPTQLPEAPVLGFEGENTMQAQWVASNGYGLPIIKYSIQIFNTTSTELFRIMNVSNLVSSNDELWADLSNLTAASSYQVRISACSVARCGALSALSLPRSTLASTKKTTMADIGELVQQAAVVASASANVSVLEGSMSVQSPPEPPPEPIETVENQTLINILQNRASQAAVSAQASMFASVSDFAIGFAPTSLKNQSFSKQNASTVVLDLQLVRKTDGDVDHDGAGQNMMVLWEALSTGSNALVAPNDLQATSGFVMFVAGDVNKTLTFSVTDNDDTNFGNPHKNFRLRLTSSVYSLVSGRDTIWLTITDDNEEFSTVSLSLSSVEIYVGLTASVQILRTGWIKPSLRLTFSTRDNSAKRDIDYSLPSLQLIVAAGISQSFFDIPTMDAGRFSNVDFRLVLDKVESECVVGSGNFACAGAVETEEESASVVLDVFGLYEYCRIYTHLVVDRPEQHTTSNCMEAYKEGRMKEYMDNKAKHDAASAAAASAASAAAAIVAATASAAAAVVAAAIAAAE